MNLKGPAVRAFSALPLCLLAASCSLLGEAWHKSPPPPPVVGPPAEPLPQATQRFTLEAGQDVVGTVQVTTATKEDTLTDIARRFNVGYEEIARANPGVDPWVPGEGRQIVVPTQFILPNVPREGLVINVPQMRLFYYPKRKSGEQQVVITHPIGIGKVGWRTPEGITQVVRKQKDPTWRPPPSIIKEHRENGEELDPVIGPGPDNPLGRYAFYLAWPSYMIHGTNKPAGVGLRSSHGCLRLYPEDIQQLFEIMPLGTQVRVVNEPFVFGWRNDQLHLQAFDVLEDDARDWKKAERKLLTKSLGESIRKELKKRGEEINWDRIAAFTHDPRGIPVPISGSEAGLDEVLAGAIKVQNRVPEGATWDGKSDLPMDEATFRQVFSERESVETTPTNAQAPQETAPKAGT